MSDSKSLNQEQLEAISYDLGPLLIIAGAGTGKTTVITERIKHFILNKHIDPERILALTFTEKAAKEMEERIDVALPYGYSQLWIHTFHAFCDRILRDEAFHIGISPSYKLVTEAQALLFMKKRLFSFELEYFRPLGNPDKFLQGLLQHFNRLKDEDISPDDYLTFANEKMRQENQTEEDEEENKKILELASAYKTFQELKIQEGLMDFSDLIFYTLNLFRQRKHILKEYKEKFKYILIDEFQDTNYAQNQLALLLTGNDQNITVVGDDDQAIYRWRGAAVSNMIQFNQHFPKTKIITLNKNYRSSQMILNASHQLVEHNNPDRLEVKENINKKLIAMTEKENIPLELIISAKGENEAERVVETIKTLMEKYKYSYKDFAILVRANDHAQPFIREFEYNDMPYQFLGPSQLFHQEEIKDLIAYLKVLYNIEDSISLYRVLSMKFFSISSLDIAKVLIVAKKENKTLFETLENVEELQINEESKEKIKAIKKMIANHLTLVSEQSAGQILYAFFQDSGLLKYYSFTKTQQDAIKVENIAKFFEKLKSFESQEEKVSIYDIVDWVDLSMQLGESPLAAAGDWSQNDAVNILTIHSSKGLEFPVVFVVNIVTQRFPSRERREQIPIPQQMIKETLPSGDYHLQEERRLCYVAMTRAKERLFMTASFIYGEGKRERKLSPFIYETFPEDKIFQEKSEIAHQASQKTINDIFPTASSETEKSQNIQKTPITYLSYSQIQTFDICPLHYKLRYIMNVPTEPTPAQVFGISVHATLRDFYQRAISQQNPTIEQVPHILEENWNKIGFESKIHERKAFQEAERMIKAYINNHFSFKNLPLALELPFQIPITSSLKLGGRIDRIDRLSENKFEIIDYKTGNHIPSDKDIEKDFQLTIYALAATELKDGFPHSSSDEILLSLVYLSADKKITTTRSVEQLEKAKQELIKKAEEISSSDFLCSKTQTCENCEYKMICNASLS